MIDHVTSSTGLVLPVERIVRELDARGVDTLIDGAHAPGMVPLQVAALRPAYYTGNLHKWVCAPKGAAFLWVREDKQASLQPCVVSHGNNTPRAGYSSFQDRFDWAGTSDPTPWMCVGETIRWMGALLRGGWPEIQRRNRELAIEARGMLCRRLGVEAPCPETMIGSLATLPLPERFQATPRSGKIDGEQLRLYDEFRIEVPFYWIGAPERRFLRISAQLYNRMNDYRRLASGLEMI
jgi:isopenicillin-N epimerase